jgi:mono/diheme cytochrome c family protein
VLPVILLAAPPACRSADGPKATQSNFFDTQVRPILQANCLACHGGEKKIRGGLRLTSRELILKGGNTGPAVSLEKPEDSLLLQAINYRDLQMPPKGKLSQSQIDTLARWVRMGVPWAASGEELSAKRSGPPPVDARARNFWSFKPVVHPSVPNVRNEAWSRNPIDAFIMAKLEAAGIEPALPADRTALLRRVYYAVTGLPPTPAEVNTFLADRSPDAYEKTVERLLTSRHYGEHWGRHWLDLVRYAETNSFERDGAKPFAWRYRDYVVRSFNDDKPYDRFIREQLAGDELKEVTSDSIIATGYYRLGAWDDEPADPIQSYYEELDDVVATTGQVFLGLTVNCGRCHDHKIDPFPQKDYYRMLSFFHGIRRYANGADSLRLIADEAERRRHQSSLDAHAAKLAEVDKQMATIEDMVRPHLGGGERDDFMHEHYREGIIKRYSPKVISVEISNRYTTLLKKRDELRRHPPLAGEQALCVTEDGPKAKDTFVLLRGNSHNHGDKVEPGFPSVLEPPGSSDPSIRSTGQEAKTCGRRRVLAHWISDPHNPLTARVMANRIWQHHFGRGIVRTTNDFGYQGAPPTHPELLDWLASELIAGGWRLKPLHRLILTSQAFRMASTADAATVAKDPENDLLARFDMRRLTAEELRDSILSVSGNLNLTKTGGPSVYPIIPAEVLAGQSRPGDGWRKSTPQDAAARSVFIHVKRSLAVPLLAVYDAPEPDATCPVRFTTTQPTQALAMINSEFIQHQAKFFADSIRAKAGADAAAQVSLTLLRVLQRPPTPAEVDRGVRFLTQTRDRDGLSADEALRRFCLLALNLNEFVYLN